MNKKAFQNAFALDMAMGGSTNTVLHILAMATEAGVKFSLDDIDRVSKKTPNICRLAPSPRRKVRFITFRTATVAAASTLSWASCGGIHAIPKSR